MSEGGEGGGHVVDVVEVGAGEVVGDLTGGHGGCGVRKDVADRLDALGDLLTPGAGPILVLPSAVRVISPFP
jgi:hypothetical protein